MEKRTVGVVFLSLMVIKKVVNEKHKAQSSASNTRACHSSNRKHGQGVLVSHALKNTLAIISDVVA